MKKITYEKRTEIVQDVIDRLLQHDERYYIELTKLNKRFGSKFVEKNGVRVMKPTEQVC